MVLIVEDSAEIRETIAAALRDEGYIVATASNGVEALAFLKVNRPCLMLLDLQMPVMNGWQVIEQMNQDPALAVPFCVVSAMSNNAPVGAACVMVLLAE